MLPGRSADQKSSRQPAAVDTTLIRDPFGPDVPERVPHTGRVIRAEQRQPAEVAGTDDDQSMWR